MQPEKKKAIRQKTFRNGVETKSSVLPRYILKPLGYSGHSYDGDGFPDRLNFARQPKSVNVDDILVAYSVSNGRLVGYYKVTTEPAEDATRARWPWYVEGQNLSPKYSRDWKKNTLFLTDLEKSYLKEQSNGLITYRGGTTLGALNFGADKIRLDLGFAQYLIDKMNNF